jgi:hypothetical protein
VNNNIISEFNSFLYALKTINRNPFFKPHWDRFIQKKLLNIVFKYVVITAVHFMLNLSIFSEFSDFPINTAWGYALQTTYLQQQNVIFFLFFFLFSFFYLTYLINKKKDIQLVFARITPLSSHQILIGSIASHLLYAMFAMLLIMLFAMLVFLAHKVELTYVLTTIVNFSITIFLFLAIIFILYLVGGIRIRLRVLIFILINMILFFITFFSCQKQEIEMSFMTNEKYIQVLPTYFGFTLQFVPTSAKLACSAKHFISEKHSCVYKIQNRNIDVDTLPRIFEKIDPYLHAKSKELISTLNQNYEIINRVNINLNQLKKQAVEAEIQDARKLRVLPLSKKEKWFFSRGAMDNVYSLLGEVSNIEYLKGESLDDDLIIEILNDINKLKDEAENIETSQQELMILLSDNKLPISLDFDYYTSNSLMLGMVIIIKIFILIFLYIWGVKNILRCSKSL